MENGKLDVKVIARDRMELRIHAIETMKTVVAWIDQANPQAWLPESKGEKKSEEPIVSKEETKVLYRDFVSQAGQIITKGWKPCELLIDDLTNMMEMIVAESKKSPENKQ